MKSEKRERMLIRLGLFLVSIGAILVIIGSILRF